jgi:5-hydroxyisourate hydrolase-like protein (transthyretin family)
MKFLVILCLATATSASAQRGGGGGGRGGQNQGQPGQAAVGAQPPQVGQGPGQGTPSVTLPPGSVEGRVMSITGEPLRKVSVSLRPNGRGGGNYSTTSGADGSFRFPSVDQGNYALTGERTGYVRETLSSTDGQTRVIEVVSEKNTSGIELKLTPQSVVAGHVFDEDGDPLQSVTVEVWRFTYPRGRKQLAQAQSGSTNDLGEFRIANLAPGRYYLSATNPRRGPLQAFLDGGGRGGRDGRNGRGGGRAGPVDVVEDYVTTYYPNAVEATAASPLELTAGSELRGLDIRLAKARYHRVTGTVQGIPVNVAADASKARAKGKAADGSAIAFPPGRGIIVALAPRAFAGGRGGQLSAAIREDDSFEFPAVPPGSYYLIVQNTFPGQQGVTARVPVDVGNGDVNNVAVRLQPALAVSGKVTVDSTQPNVRLGSLRLTFTPSEPGPGNQGRNGQTQIADDGTFQATLAADAYLVEAGGLPDGYYLKSVKLAGREMPDATLDLNYGGGQVDVVLAPAAGDLTGTVQNARGEPAASVQVTAVPVSGSLRRDMNKLVTTDASGNFTLHGLPPGDYKIFAWEQVDANAWMDRDYRQPFENLAASAKVQESTSPTVTLRLIERGRSR